MDRLPSRREGYTLDLDSTRLLHEDGHQAGIEVSYTRIGLKPCLHPLLAVIAEARLVMQLWLWDKILSPFPNCNAVENRPAFAS